jgi:hypothetical protein
MKQKNGDVTEVENPLQKKCIYTGYTIYYDA